MNDLIEIVKSICNQNNILVGKQVFEMHDLDDDQKTAIEIALIKHWKIDKVIWMPNSSILTKNGLVKAHSVKLRNYYTPTYLGRTIYLHRIYFVDMVRSYKHRILAELNNFFKEVEYSLEQEFLLKQEMLEFIGKLDKFETKKELIFSFGIDY